MIAFAAIQAAVLAQLTICGWVLPALSGPIRSFDVPVPERESARALDRAVRRWYRMLVLAAGAVVTAVTLAATWHGTVTAIGQGTTAAIASLFLLGCLARWHARAALVRALADLPDEAVPAATPGGGRFPGRWVLPVIGVLALTVAVGAARYRGLPPALTVRWSGGLADGSATTTAEAAFSLVPAQLLLGLTTLAALGSGWPGGTAQPAASARRTARAVLALCGIAQLCLFGGSLVLWGLLPAPPA